METFNACCKDITEAIDVCFVNRKIFPSLMLLYSGIDIMACFDLPDNKEKVTRSDFIDWTEKYLLPGSSLECSGIDLYATRCGALHSYSFKSDISRNQQAKEIFYSWGIADIGKIRKLISDNSIFAVPVHIDDFILAFKKGVKSFQLDVNNDATKKNNIHDKSRKNNFSMIFIKREKGNERL